MNSSVFWWATPTWNLIPITELSREEFFGMLKDLTRDEEDFQWFKDHTCVILNDFFFINR